MAHLKIFLHLPAKDALARAAAHAGDFDREITPDDAVELRDCGLLDLAARYTGLDFAAVNARLTVAGPDWGDVLGALSAERQALEDAHLKRAAAARAIASLLEKRGTDEQRQRFLAGVLPEDEILTLARDVAFMTFEGFKRRKKLEDRDVRHKPTCNAMEISYESIDNPPLERFLFARKGDFERASVRAPIAWQELGLDRHFTNAPQIVHRRHMAVCLGCGGERVQDTVHVTVPWLDRQLVREYTLESSP